MNIEDLAKDTEKAKEPAKKKGYDDVEISDLSGEDEQSKKSKIKDVKKTKKSETEKKEKPKTEKKEKKESEKKQPKTAKSEEVQQKTPVFKTIEKTEEKTHEDQKPSNVMTIPKYQAAPLPAGSGKLFVNR
ncbi:hypothetical protein ANCCAN_21839 [Ancylostoma caninum]|uniref:Uncharacterized protein n=1 Tax=Ancylostoma caninum TaxID=29170 RepID=A0A368FJE0_ANCCA|nr:hypothetical protein ANCCAN_21839 [Ancylostoma caninum]